MRKAPFNWALRTASSDTAEGDSEKIKETAFEDSLVFDLEKEFARPKPKPAPVKEQSEVTTDEPEVIDDEEIDDNEPGNASEPEKPGGMSGKLRDDIDKYKKELEKEINVAIENPKRASENVLRFFNVIRLFAYPWIYKKILFDGAELPLFEQVLKKQVQAKMSGQKLELTPAEQDMAAKIEFFKNRKLEIPWSEQEIKDGAEVAYMKLAEIKFLQWLMQNEWAIYFFVLESKRFGPLLAYRFGLGEVKL